MSPISLVLNIIWIIFGGGLMAIGWLIAGFISIITVILLPWSRSCFEIASYTLLPFGRRAVNRYELTGREDIGTGELGCLGNIIWFFVAGWWLALGHIFAGIAFAITIIGLPFAVAHFKLVRISLAPIGMTVIEA